jgi:hypothetical protein
MTWFELYAFVGAPLVGLAVLGALVWWTGRVDRR